MHWEKVGRIFCPNNNYNWMYSHAANPIAEQVSDNYFKIYFNTRDAQQRSSISWLIIDITQPLSILELANKPVLIPGETGLFDDSGISLGCLIEDKFKYLYYLGWNLGVTVPWRNSIGLAIEDHKDGIFRKFSNVPILDRSKIDPYSLSYPWVIKEKNTWKMWYGSNLSWSREKYNMSHVIKYAECDDGIHWSCDGHISINFKDKSEYALARPCVISENELYRMWYSYRGDTYRIGYAQSHDGRNWQRLDNQVGIDVSSSGWDSEMICYATVFEHASQYYMLYCGNGYGKSGFGLAIMK
jgi:predicted GH43/DUF377 family glycosyl hydrolase